MSTGKRSKPLVSVQLAKDLFPVPTGFVTDLHFTGKRPRRRTDKDYQTFLLRSFEEDVVKPMLARGVRHLLIGGDVFHKWDRASFGLIHEVRHLLSRFDEVDIVWGNHDVPGYNYSHPEDTALQNVVDGCVNVRVSSDDDIMIGDTLVFFVSPGTAWGDSLMANDDSWVHEASLGGPAVVVAHLPIGPETNEYVKGIKDFDFGFDLLLLGDQHPGHEPYVCPRGCVCCNPGAFAVRNEDEKNRVPSWIFLYKDQLEYWPIPQPPSDTVFAEAIADQRRIDTADLVKSLRKAQEAGKAKSMKDVVRETGASGKFSQAAIDELVKELEHE